VRADPSFQQAQQQQQAAEAAPAVQASPGDVVTVAATAADVTVPVEPAAVGALQQATTDVSPSPADALTATGITSIASHPTNESQGITSVVSASGVIRIIFKLPLP